jgi:hypothetical protein
MNKPRDLVIFNYTVKLSKSVVYEAYVWVDIGVREENISFQGLYTIDLMGCK